MFTVRGAKEPACVSIMIDENLNRNLCTTHHADSDTRLQSDQGVHTHTKNEIRSRKHALCIIIDLINCDVCAKVQSCIQTRNYKLDLLDGFLLKQQTKRKPTCDSTLSLCLV